MCVCVWGGDSRSLESEEDPSPHPHRCSALFDASPRLCSQLFSFHTSGSHPPPLLSLSHSTPPKTVNCYIVNTQDHYFLRQRCFSPPLTARRSADFCLIRDFQFGCSNSRRPISLAAHFLLLPHHLLSLSSPQSPFSSSPLSCSTVLFLHHHHHYFFLLLFFLFSCCCFSSSSTSFPLDAES